MVKPTSPRPAESSDSKYKGVRKRKWGKYVSEIRLPNSRERIWLGSYSTPEKAARAFDAALFCLRGETAKFNFPDNPPNIAGGRSLTPSEIQAAAARFANSDPRESNSGSGQFSDSSSSSEENEAESPSPSVSDAPAEGDTASLDPGFVDQFATIGSENSVPDFGIFPGFDDLSNEFFMPPINNVDYGEENFDGVFTQDSSSFLWNF